MRKITTIKRHLKSLEKMEQKRIQILGEDLSLIISLSETEINECKKAIVEYIEGLNLSPSYKTELKGLYNNFFFLSLNKDKEEKKEILEIIAKITNYSKFRNFIRGVKKDTPQSAFNKVNEVKKGGNKSPKRKSVEIKINKFEGDAIPSNDEVIVEGIKNKISEVLNEGNPEKLIKLYEFLKGL